MYIEKRLIVPLSLILLVVGLVTLLAVVGMTFWLGNRTNEHFDGVIRSRDVRVAAVEIRSAVQSAEASQRGLLLTGNQIYLSPYDAAKATANRQLILDEILTAILSFSCTAAAHRHRRRKIRRDGQNHRVKE